MKRILANLDRSTATHQWEGLLFGLGCSRSIAATRVGTSNPVYHFTPGGEQIPVLKWKADELEHAFTAKTNLWLSKVFCAKPVSEPWSGDCVSKQWSCHNNIVQTKSGRELGQWSRQRMLVGTSSLCSWELWSKHQIMIVDLFTPLCICVNSSWGLGLIDGRFSCKRNISSFLAFLSEQANVQAVHICSKFFSTIQICVQAAGDTFDRCLSIQGQQFRFFFALSLVRLKDSHWHWHSGTRLSRRQNFVVFWKSIVTKWLIAAWTRLSTILSAEMMMFMYSDLELRGSVTKLSCTTQARSIDLYSAVALISYFSIFLHVASPTLSESSSIGVLWCYAHCIISIRWNWIWVSTPPRRQTEQYVVQSILERTVNRWERNPEGPRDPASHSEIASRGVGHIDVLRPWLFSLSTALKVQPHRTGENMSGHNSWQKNNLCKKWNVWRLIVFWREN